ncbi:CYFA0S02e06964g1_1 [Cyberlindnera fabianii]|uniref:CYFA0S02e06964g1_1 n=1 Tax=Cyberlindnera fabianii TaxID=36022 RepID=A0A061AMK8_CYBFA|nr:Sulfite efflux pump SSU1 [Cyberlindnera fabianii]CDR38845.1 CYFA0S02e06964g1_1 [Cyberlindnera fabianii]
MHLPEFRTQWFICSMATGMATSILYNFPYPARWLRDISYIMFALCSLSLLITNVLFFNQLIRSRQYRHDALFNIHHNVFLGCGVMGYTSWVTSMHLVSQGRVPIFTYVLWWISNLLSLGAAWVIFLCIIWKTDIRLEKLSATVILPIVTLTLTAAQGGIITPSLPQPLQHSTIIISFLIWANAVALSFMVLTIYLNRLVLYKFPSKSVIFTSFIPIGFLGQGSLAIQLFGRNYHDYVMKGVEIMTEADALSTKIQGDIFLYAGVLAGLFLEAMGFCMTFFAVWAVLSSGKHHFHYGWWAMTFPLGTMCLSTHQTAQIMDWETFYVVATIYGTVVLMITIVCISMSLLDLYRWIRSSPETEAATVEESKRKDSLSTEHTAPYEDNLV